MKTLFAGLLLFNGIGGYAQSSFTVHFDFNKYELTAEARSQLDSFLRAEKNKLPALIIALNGHCDAIGSDQYNTGLSKQRVAAVKKYFIEKGIAASNIGDEIGHGKNEPLNDNRTAEERQLNRRVEISFMPVVITDLPGTASLKERLADSATTAGSTLVLKNINFIGGTHRFLDESYPAIEELLEAMISNPTLVIRIEGHVCCEAGEEDGNDLETGLPNLSEARAKAVMDYLLQNGIAGDRLSYKGFGHSRPLYAYPERSEEEKTGNRRVEIKIIHK